MSKPRHRKNKPHLTKPKHGDVIFVSRLINPEQAVSYNAIYFELPDGRVHLEKVRPSLIYRTRAVERFFEASKDLPIPGYIDWFMISGHPVQLNKHTRIRTMTGILFRQFGPTDEFATA